jgi:hypothetical protein
VKRLTVHLDNCLIKPAGQVKFSWLNTIWHGSNTLITHQISRLVIFTCSQQSKKDQQRFRWSTRKTCSIDCANFWMKFSFENWGRYLPLGSNASRL